MWRKVAMVALMALLPVAAVAQPAANNWELTLVGSGSNNEDFDTGGFQVGGQLGYYYTPELEVYVRQDVGYFDDNSGTNVVASTSVGADYHFDLGKWRPFIGANIGYLYGDQDETFQAGPEVGLKYFVNNTTFIYGQMQYQFFFDELEQADEEADDGRFIYQLGIGFLF